MHVAHACKNRRLLRCWRSHGLSHLRARSGGGMFGFRVQSTRQSAHAKDLPATLGHAAHLKATKRDVRSHSPAAPAPQAVSVPIPRLRPHATRRPALHPRPRPFRRPAPTARVPATPPIPSHSPGNTPKTPARRRRAHGCRGRQLKNTTAHLRAQRAQPDDRGRR